jgi:hypothetical protein
MQHIYSDPTFQMACDQFRLIAEHLQIPKDLRDRLIYPKRSIAVTEQSFTAVIKRAKEEKISHRLAALVIGVERVVKARQDRGLFP